MSFELDYKFNGTGKFINTSSESLILTTHIQDGKILSAGYYYDEGNDAYYVFITRHKFDGTIDTTFGVTGYVYTTYESNTSDFSKIMISAPDNKFLIFCKDPSGNNFVVIRFNINGEIDTTFGTTGFLNTGYDFNSSFFCSIINDNSTGFILSFVDSVLKFRRYNLDGTTNGDLTSTVFNFSGRYCYCNTIDGSGNLIFAGRENGGAGSVPNPFLYVMYGVNDDLNTSIGTAGYVYFTHNENGNQGYSSVKTDNSNNIILVGDYGETILIHKYNSAGELIYYNRDEEAYGGFTCVNIDSNNKILIGVQKDYDDDNTTESFYLLRLNQNLTLDTDFGSNGIIRTQLTTDGIYESRVFNLTLYSNNHIIASGYISTDDVGNYCIISYVLNETDVIFAELLPNIYTNKNLLENNIENFGENREYISNELGKLLNEILLFRSR
jgi:uncharacterized delta-60 repeat protein